jgi:hypothetical protein
MEEIMKKSMLGIFTLVLGATLFSAQASALCYRFSAAGSEVGVCIKGDSFADRKKAQEICKKGEGKDCGNITSTSSSCHSNSGRCYDASGNKSRSLSGY